jgi:hypothetical protein
MLLKQTVLKGLVYRITSNLVSILDTGHQFRAINRVPTYFFVEYILYHR